jgi:ketosteroid isomerase-like protein
MDLDQRLGEGSVRINPAHGTWLTELMVTIDLVWATAWNDDADRLPAPVKPRGRESTVPATPTEIYHRYLWASALTRNADAVAEMFAVDGLIEAPLVSADQAFPRRVEGREEIRRALAEYYARDAYRQGELGDLNKEKSRYAVHATADPDVFVVETDTAFDRSEGVEFVSMVKIFRMRDGEIVLLRDYFAPDLVD